MTPPTSGAAAALPQSGARAVWIDGRWRDLLFYVATPLLLLPLVLLLPGRPAVQDLVLFVGAFGALGHHLPGMMRAYGDRALFTRFRVRFVLAPILLIAVCIFFTVRDLGGVILVTFLWTTWHSLMQIFGFARIYDAKVGSVRPWTSRLDQALCLVWIGAPILLSDSRLGSVLELWYQIGAPLIAPAFVAGARSFWLSATIGVSLAWLVHTVLAWRAGSPPNAAKLALFASSFAFWWVCMAGIDNLLVGVRMFDIFHDVQYLALVWTFNKARVARDPAVGGFSRFLFRGQLSLAGIYVGLVVAYGSIGYLGESIHADTVRRSLLGVLAASALLHFYFDGFIWKVRERSTRDALSIAGGAANKSRALTGGAVHAAKWSLFALPLGIFYWWETHDTRPEIVWREAVVAAVPESAEALASLGKLIDPRAEPERALAVNRSAVERKPGHPAAHNNLGVALYLTGQLAPARARFEEALRLAPDYAIAHRHLAGLLTKTGELDLAEHHYREAIANDPEDAAAHAGLGAVLAGRGRPAEAIELYETALALAPTERTALNGLAWLRATHPDASLRNGDAAVEYAQALVQQSSSRAPLALATLAAAYAEAGRFDEAVAAIREAIATASAGGAIALAENYEVHLRAYLAGEPLRTAR